MQQLIADLIQEPDARRFLERLQELPGRSAAGFTQLETALLDVNADVPARLDKLEIIILGPSSMSDGSLLLL